MTPDAPTMSRSEADALEVDWHTLRVLDGRESEAWLRGRGEAVPEPKPGIGLGPDGRGGVMW